MKQISPPLRILHILNNLGSGGAESMLMNIYRKIDRSKIQFDFMIRSEEGNFLSDEIKHLGGRIFTMPSFPRHLFRNIQAVDKFFDEHLEYSIIHVHANSLIYTIPLFLGKRHGIPCRIIHSHNTDTFAGNLRALSTASIAA